MAAVLASGPGALLSHRTAAHARGFTSRSPATVEVVTPRQVRPRRGIHARMDSGLTAADADIADGIPCLSVARTLLTLAAVLPQDLDGAVARAEKQRALRLDAVEELLERVPGRPGSALLRTALADLMLESTWTRTELERRFLALCRAAGLPRPRVNAWISLPGNGFEVDFSWSDHRLAVETDGHEDHAHRAAFEEDRRRDQLLAAAGWRVVRFTWRQIVREPRVVAEILRRVLLETHVRGDVAR